jgi:hypothetical protein
MLFGRSLPTFQFLAASIIKAMSKHLWNVSKLPSEYTSQQSRTHLSSYSLPWEREIDVLFWLHVFKTIMLRLQCRGSKFVVTTFDDRFQGKRYISSCHLLEKFVIAGWLVLVPLARWHKNFITCVGGTYDLSYVQFLFVVSFRWLSA